MYIIQGTGERLRDFNYRTGKENRWHIYKLDNIQLSADLEYIYSEQANLFGRDWYEQQMKKVERVNDCSDFLIFGRWQDENGNKHGKLIKANFCKHRLCATCNWRKSLVMYAQTNKIVEEMEKRQPTARYIFLTLTMKNMTSDKLSESIDKLLKASSAIYSQNAKGAKSLAGFRKYLLGGQRILEITYNYEADTYHPHLHLVLAVKPVYFAAGYITQERWCAYWQELLGVDYTPMVGVTTIKPKADKSQAKKGEKSMAGAVAEVSKYPIKSFEILHIEDDNKRRKAIKVLLEASYNRRFVSFFGEFANIRKDLRMSDIEKANLIETGNEDEPTGDSAMSYYLYKFNVKAGCYIC